MNPSVPPTVRPSLRIVTETPADTLAFLRSLSLLRDAPAQLENAFAAALQLRFQRHEALVLQGAPSDGVLLIRRGIAAATRQSWPSTTQDPLGVLVPGDLVGEIGVLCGTLRTATVTALTEVDVLVIPGAEFLARLEAHPQFCVALARSLATRLATANQRILGDEDDPRLIVICARRTASDAVDLAAALARHVTADTGRPVALTAVPHASGLAAQVGLPPSPRAVQRHPDGYDVVVHARPPGSAASVHSALLVDALRQRWSHSLVCVSTAAWADAEGILESAHAVVIVDTPQGWAAAPDLGPVGAGPPSERIRVAIGGPAPDAEFVIPEDPSEDEDAVRALVTRLGRTTDIGLYVPRTSIDGSDATAVVDRTHALFIQLFGTASCEEARGPWRTGLASVPQNDVRIVRSYTSDAELAVRFDAIVDHVDALKRELGQESVAVEAKGRLTVL